MTSTRLPRALPIAFVLALACATAASADNVVERSVDPVDFDRWMYPFNGTPGTRNLAPTFGAIDSLPDFDNKDGQLILGVDTAAAGVPSGFPASSYDPIRVIVRVTHQIGAFDYDPSYDAWQTYLDPGDPSYLADADAGRPIELYGTGYRSGYGAPLSYGPTVLGPAAFEEGDRFCEGCTFGQPQEVRNVFPFSPAAPDPEGDVSNNVARGALGGSPFDAVPFAIGASTSGLTPGDPVPEAVPGASPGETFAFELDLGNPDVYAYVQQGLADGSLEFVVTSMHGSIEGVGGTNPNFFTSENVDAAAIAPSLELEVELLPEPSAAAGLLSGALLVGRLARRRRRG